MPLLAALLLAPVLAVPEARAETEVRDDWTLIPTGLGKGSRFRLLFVTQGKRNATSSDIGDYNSFVQAQAAGGHSDVQAHSGEFRAVVSTTAVDARDNTRATGTGVPVYWLGGDKIADDYPEFYSCGWDSRATRHPSGTETTTSNQLLWTGSTNQGTEYIGTNNFSQALGTGNPRLAWTKTGCPLQASQASGSSAERLYALSPVFRVVAVANRSPTGAPSIRLGGAAVGSAGVQVGHTLTAAFAGAFAGIMDEDGLPDADGDGTTEASDFTYQWIRTVGAKTAEITGETGATYKTVAADLGATLQVRVSFTDGEGSAESLASAAAPVLLTAAAAGPDPAVANGPFPVTFTFGGAVRRFHQEWFIVTGGTLSSLTATGNTGEYSATVMPGEGFEGLLTVRALAGAAEEANGTVNPEASNLLKVVVDRTAPEAQVAPVPGQREIPVRGPFEVAVRFGEAVTGFALDDLEVGNGVASMLRAAGAPGAYTVRITPPALFVGVVTVDVPAGAAMDVAGNESAAAAQYVRAADLSPPTKVALALNPARVWEGGGAVAVTVTATLDGAWPADTPLSLAVAGSGEANVVGFAPVSAFTMTVPAGKARATGEFTLTPEDDAVDESDETVTVSGTVASAPGVSVIPATLVLSDEEALSSLVVLSLSRAELSEDAGASGVTVTATLSGDVRSADTAVAVTVSGTGEAGVVGFAPVAPFTLTIPSGHTSGAAVITLTPEDDYTDETNETITVAGTAALTVAPAALTLVDDDATSTTLHWTISPLEIAEGAGPTEVTVSFSLDAAARTVDTELIGLVRAARREDISHPLSHIQSFFEFNFTLPADATSGTGVFTLTPVQDDIVENEDNDPEDEVSVNFNPETGSGLLSVPDEDLPTRSSRPNDVILSFIDDDSLGPDVRLLNCRGPTVYISFEERGSGGIAPVTGLTLEDLVVENGTATALTGASDEYQATLEVADEFEGERTITVPFGAAQDADGQANSPASCTAFFDKRPPRVAITGPASGGPVHGPFAVRIVFDEPVREMELADLTVGNGTASALRPVEASQGEVRGSYAEYVATITPAGSGTVTVDVAAGAARDGKRNDNLAAAQYSIEMVAPEVALSLSHSELSEGSGATEVTVIATVAGGALVEALPVTVAVSGSGDAGVDETVTVGGTASLPWIAVEAATLGLLDNDEASTALLLTATPDTVAEGAGATEVTVTATLDGAARTAETEVTVTVSGSDATGVEFSAVEPFTLTIAAGVASGSASFTLTPTDDAWDRADTAVSLTAATTGLTSGGATVLLTDDDEASSRVSLSLSVTELAEAAAATEVTVTAKLSAAPREEATDLALSVAGVTAGATDFAAVPDFTLTFPAGDTSVEGTFTLAPVADALDEANETVAVRGVAEGLAVSPATVAIVDDDDPPAISVADTAAAEGAGEMTFTVTLDAPSGREVSVSWATANGTALAPGDYLAATGSLTFASGATSRTFSVTLVDDDIHEEAETFAVALSDPVHATIGGDDADAEGRIADDDPMPRVRLAVAAPAGGVVAEGAGATVVTLTGRLEGAARSTPTVMELSVTGVTALRDPLMFFVKFII